MGSTIPFPSRISTPTVNLPSKNGRAPESQPLDDRFGRRIKAKRQVFFLVSRSAATVEPGGGAQRPRPPQPPRPAVTLPSRTAIESLFRPVDFSPGLSSLLAEPELDYGASFSQLLAGAIGPSAAASASAPRRVGEEEEEDSMNGESKRGGKEVALSLGRSRPASLMLNQTPAITFPAGISPSSLFQSPLSLYSQNQGQFELNHVQGSHLHPFPYIPPEFRSTTPTTTITSTTSSLRQLCVPPFNLSSIQQMPYLPLSTYNSSPQLSSLPFADKKPQTSNLIADKPADDGYNWRKYGQKQVKGGEYPRSYYKCTHPKCPVKKKVERSFDAQVTEIIYKGQHNHQPPQPIRQGKEGGGLASDFNPETSLQGSRQSEATYKRDRESDFGSMEHLSDSSDDEQDEESSMGRRDEMDEIEPDSKRINMNPRNIKTTSYKTMTEPKVIVQTTSEVDLLDDGYRWRKYGQKVVKGNPHPRSYYKCTNIGCNVRKHIERASSDPKAVITTYEGKHNHDLPEARTSSHNVMNAGGSTSSNTPPSIFQNNPPSLNRTVVELKKEDESGHLFNLKK
ncbi:hypothetical protein ZIOFF_013190 [Zingiber officinale]|uniref:WRKY domain-containing protein n=1 Tax=Zingiber officinale TaxID=94328 RepID=A0A8J5LPV6_ZINOF|nr:hypothetical protein ZIOFF_013190 [Zingiber officinale]